MKKVKKILGLGIGLAVLFFGGCKPLDDPTLPKYDESVYNVSMREALQASQDFVNQSIKFQQSKEVFANPTEEDLWQGYIQNENGKNWNVPSNVYGTSLETAENELVVDGEELGTLQELVFHKDENGNFTKAVFEYKNYLYYVMDYKNLYVVLSSEDNDDNYEHICFTQKGKLDSPDFSNFKIWVWDNKDGELYRKGNLGYAYTLRNVQMLDGSYATVTVSDYNYYDYGFRVWIQETKKPYEREVLKDFADDVTTDFIYRIENKTSGKLTVNSYIRDVNVKNFERGIKAVSEAVEIEKDGTYEFKFDLKSLRNKYTINDYLGCYFYPEGKWRDAGWENALILSYNIHTVTVYDSEEYCMEGKNSWEVLDKQLPSAKAKTFVNAVYSENPDWSEYWLVDIPSTETTKWKVTEMWFYSSEQLYYNWNSFLDHSELYQKILEKIPDSKLNVMIFERNFYSGWMPEGAKYGVCLSLRSKNCDVENVWCETIQTSVLKEVYEIMEQTISDFIINY